MAISFPKARRILNIVDPLAKPPGPGLLDLPHELRDLIWAMVLREPHLLDRKHAITCELSDCNADYETPPAAMRCIPRPRFYPAALSTPQAEANCLRSCVRRKSLALLRVSKQIHAEATKVWSEQGMHVCFLSSQDMVDRISRLSPTARQRIHHLTVCDYLPFTTIKHFDGREEYFDVLSQLENLEFIEVSPTIVREGPYWMIKLAQMQKLRKIVFSIPPKEMFGWDRAKVPAWRSGKSTFATIGIVIDVDEDVPCAHNVCARGRCDTAAPIQQRVSVEHWCSACKQTLDDIRRSARDLRYLADPTWKMEQRKVPDLSTTFRRLRHEAPTHSKEYPIRGTRIIDGQTYQTTLWGLPKDSPKVRHRREAEMRIASIATPISTLLEPDPEDNADQFKPTERRSKALSRVPIKVEAVEPYTKALARLRTRVEVRRGNFTQMMAAEARHNRNLNREKREREQRRIATRAMKVDYEELERERGEERKAARKRVSQA